MPGLWRGDGIRGMSFWRNGPRLRVESAAAVGSVRGWVASRLVMVADPIAVFCALRLICLTPVADHRPGRCSALTASRRGWMVGDFREMDWHLTDGFSQPSPPMPPDRDTPRASARKAGGRYAPVSGLDY